MLVWDGLCFKGAPVCLSCPHRSFVKSKFTEIPKESFIHMPALHLLWEISEELFSSSVFVTCCQSPVSWSCLIFSTLPLFWYCTLQQNDGPSVNDLVVSLTCFFNLIVYALIQVWSYLCIMCVTGNPPFWNEESVWIMNHGVQPFKTNM